MFQPRCRLLHVAFIDGFLHPCHLALLSLLPKDQKNKKTKGQNPTVLAAGQNDGDLLMLGLCFWFNTKILMLKLNPHILIILVMCKPFIRSLNRVHGDVLACANKVLKRSNFTPMTIQVKPLQIQPAKSVCPCKTDANPLLEIL